MGYMVGAVASGNLCILTFSGFTQWGQDFYQLWGAFFSIPVE